MRLLKTKKPSDAELQGRCLGFCFKHCEDYYNYHKGLLPPEGRDFVIWMMNTYSGVLIETTKN